MNSDFATVIDRLRWFLFWLPDWAAAIVILVIVSIAALIIHALALHLLRRARANRGEFAQLLIMRSANPTRFAIVLFALAAALPAVGLSIAFEQFLLALISAVFILLVGWSSVVAVGLASDLYLERFKSGFENALTRKN